MPSYSKTSVPESTWTYRGRRMVTVFRNADGMYQLKLHRAASDLDLCSEHVTDLFPEADLNARIENFLGEDVFVDLRKSTNTYIPTCVQKRLAKSSRQSVFTRPSADVAGLRL
jgi:hypothetical protein